ncbi:MAG: cytochrome P460 family protein [Bdellovibrionales bacterium]|nr:cytochrome P460 family protein [Bdellovibrionales bacterium]
MPHLPYLRKMMIPFLTALILLLTPVTLFAEGPNITKLPADMQQYQQWESFPNIKVNPLWEGQCSIPPMHAEYMANQAVRKGPHKDKFLSVFVNPTGSRAVRTFRVNDFPPGSIIIKEKKTTPSVYAHAVGGMLKHEPGYDSSVGDWEFIYLSEDNVFTRGNKQASSCVSCHLKASGTDFVFGNYGQRGNED